MAYVDEGPENAPLTFLLLHGNPTWGFLYRQFIRRLSTTYRVIAPDMIGFGRSDKPREPDYFTLEQHIENLTQFASRLNLKNVVLVVQDWGGPIGLAYATKNAQNIAGIVVLNTWAFVSEQGGVRLPWFFKRLLLGKSGWRRATRKNIFVELMLIKGQKLGEQEATAYRAPHPAPEDRIGIARFPQLIPEIGKPDHESYETMKTIEEDLGRLALKPALIVWPLKDIAFRKPQLLRWQEVFPNHVLHRLEGAKHYAQESHSKEILDQIEPWVKSHLGGRGRVAKPTPAAQPAAKRKPRS